MEQRSPEWFAQRAGMLTASRFSDLMATTRSGPAASRQNLIVQVAVERLTKTCAETYSNAAMQRGIDLEPVARRAYENANFVAVEEVGFVVHPELPYVGCSPDGLVGDDGLVEVKCPASMAKHYAAIVRGEHAVEYAWQLQGQMFVTGRAWVDAVSFDPRFPVALQLAVVRVERDEAKIAELRAECERAQAEICQIVDDLISRA